MRNGSRYWSHSCVELKNGKKHFVEESENKISEKLKSNDEFITLTLAGIYSSKINIRKSDISSYKYHFLF